MRCFISLVTGAFLAGCAIHPQTEDFSRIAIPDIVRKVRCEAQQALVRHSSETVEKDKKLVVAYDFDFILTETNASGTEGSVGIPISLGTFAIDWSASSGKERKATQDIRIEDTFQEILDIRGCESIDGREYKYPIRGAIGLDETFRNFFGVRSLKQLDTPSNFSDEIEFTTTLSAGIAPSIDLAPKVGRKIAAEIALGASRKDLHRVKLTIGDPKGRSITYVQLVGIPASSMMKAPIRPETGAAPTDTDRARKARVREQADRATSQRILEDLRREIDR